MSDSRVEDRSLAFVLDASALLAMLQGERGGERVEAVLEHVVISAVNWSEVVQKAAARGVPVDGLREDLRALGMAVLPFDPVDGEAAAALWPTTRSRGLSLGDRACLALAKRLGIPALTADRVWADLDLPVEIELLRR